MSMRNARVKKVMFVLGVTTVVLFSYVMSKPESKPRIHPRALTPNTAKQPTCKRDLAVMTLNVEEFLEPCFVEYRRWTSVMTANGSTIRDFARANPDVLDNDFVGRRGEDLLTWEVCKKLLKT